VKKEILLQRFNGGYALSKEGRTVPRKRGNNGDRAKKSRVKKKQKRLIKREVGSETSNDYWHSGTCDE